jgi:hypothetical protein
MQLSATVTTRINDNRPVLMAQTTHVRDVMNTQETLTNVNELALEIATEKSNEGLLVNEARESVNRCHATSIVCNEMLEKARERTREAKAGVRKLDADVDSVKRK